MKRTLIEPTLRSVKLLYRVFAQHTASSRALPDFVIIGAQKSGTTSLYHYLTCHPQVLRASSKEVHFFDAQFEKGSRWYQSFFPLQQTIALLSNIFCVPVVTGEATPSYLVDPEIPEKVQSILPNVKLIALLRHPVERAFSAHQMNVRQGIESRSFETAIEDELRGDIRGGQEKPPLYLARGDYHTQLKTWRQHFPEEQTLVIRAEDLFSSPDSVFLEVQKFLGLQPMVLNEFKVANPGQGTRVPKDIKERLREHFLPSCRHLYTLLGSEPLWEDLK